MWRWFDKLSDIDESLWLELVLEQPRPSPFLCPGFLKPWAASFAEAVRVGLWKERGLILFHRTGHSWELLGGQDVADRLDGLCSEPEFWSSLREQTASWELPVVFPNLGPDAFALLNAEESDFVEVTDCSPYVPLEGDFSAYLQSLARKPRHELKRKMAKAEREAEHGLQMLEGPEYLETFLHLHRLSSPDKEAFMQDRTEHFFRALCSSLEEAGVLCLRVLFDGTKPLAAVMELHFAGVAHLYNSGYDPAHASLSPGLTLIGRSIEAACQNRFREYDFLRGDERYKYHLGGRDRQVYRLTWPRTSNTQDD